MIKKILLLACIVHFVLNASAQIFWTENFGIGCDAGLLATSAVSANGFWTQSITGPNEAAASNWFVSATSNGNPAGQCGSGCGTDRSLHVGATVNLFGDPATENGALYYEGLAGFCGFFPCGATNKRVESPTINCSGKTSITIDFLYLEGGNAIDNATLVYSVDGINWSLLVDLPKTNNSGCGSFGLWTAYSIALPSSADNNANVKVGFNWSSNDDGDAADPSFAVDKINLSSLSGGRAPVASFTASSVGVCVGGCINFTNTSTGGPFTSTNWTFTGAATASSSANNPTNICYNGPGAYAVSLTVTNANGSDTETVAGYITVAAAPVQPTPTANSPLCAGNSINLSTAAVAGATYAWTGPGGFTSALQNPSIPSSTVSMSGTYNLVVSIGTCTAPAGSVNVVVNASPASPTGGSNSPICEGSTLNFTASNVGGATYNWTGPNGFSSSVQNPTIPSATAIASGAYSVTTTSAGCSSQPVVINVIVSALPANASASSNSPVCEGTSLNLTATDVPGATYNWTGPNGFSADTQNPSVPNANVSITGTYSVTIQIGSCISNPSTTIVSISPIPSAPGAANNGPICAGTSINLTATGVSGASFNWIGPDGFTSISQNPVISNASANASGIYSVTQSISGCSSTAATTTVTINSAPNAPTVTSNSPVCAGSTIVISAPTIQNVVYSWTGPNGYTSELQNPSIPNASAANTGVYTLTLVSTVNGCSSAPANILVGLGTGLPVIVTPDDPIIQLGQTVQLNASGGTTYSWSPSVGLSCDDCSDPIASPTLTTTYEVTAEDAQGCSGIAYVIVFVEGPCSEVFVPTIFSPNGDENNDFHCVFGSCITDFEISIFNRWGQQVFQSSNKSECWDGTFKGKDVEPGVYVYTMRAMQSNGVEISGSGNLNVIR